MPTVPSWTKKDPGLIHRTGAVGGVERRLGALKRAQAIPYAGWSPLSGCPARDPSPKEQQTCPSEDRSTATN